jgi:hypothetical protein
VTLCSGRGYRAKFFVKDAANKIVLGIDDFLFRMELADTIPEKLTITVSNATSVKDVAKFGPIELSNTSTWPEVLPVKGDWPVTVNVRAFNVSGTEILVEKLDYHWELCCGDQQNKTPIDTQSPTWTFEPPTHIPEQTLTIKVSNENGYSLSAKIQFSLDH